VGEWRVTPHRNVISRGDEEKHLENRLMRTLIFLAEHESRVVTREQFFNSVWQDRVVNEEALSRAISLLRTALDDSARAPKYIQTVPGVGYRLVALVTDTAVPEGSVPCTGDAPENSIAVLPFVNLSNDPDNEYFSDGISEEILNSLTQVKNFKVVGRTSSFVFKDRNEDLREIGRVLDVTHVLEGSVRKAGARVRITAQLIKADDGYHLWSETFDKTLEDIFAVQDEIASAVVRELKARLLGEAYKVRETDADAYSLYLRGLYFIHSGDSAGIQKALDLFLKVIELDPEYAPAWVKIADAYEGLMSYGLLRRDEGISLAVNAVSRALALDNQLAGAYLLRAKFSAFFSQDWSAAYDDMARARQIAPGSAGIFLQSGNQASNIGNHEEAVTLLKRAIALDPLNTTGHIWLSMSFIALTRFSEARETLLQALELKPQRAVAHMLLGKTLLLQGEASASHEEMLQEPAGFWRDFGLAQSYYSLGQQREADATFSTLIETYSNEAPFQIAELHALRREFDAAFNWLDRAHEGHDNGLSELFDSPFLKALQEDSRWAVFVKKMGLEWPLPW